MPPKDLRAWIEENYTYAGSASWNTRPQWDDYMQRIRQVVDFKNHRFFISFAATSGMDQFYDSFPWTEFAVWVNQNRSHDLFVIIDAHTEGPCFEHVRTITNKIVNHFNLKPDHILLWTGSISDGSEPIGMLQNLNAFSLVSGIGKIVQTPVPTHHFVMLARVPRRHRINAAVGIVQRDLEKYGYVSCGCGNYGPIRPSDFDNIVPDEIRHKFPMFIDGYVEEGFHHSDDVLWLPQTTGAFCQFIPESSHEYNRPGWSTAFATEKSEKCFLLGQVPIWVGAYKQADALRRHGFDIFDDLIDHSYDIETDPVKRLELALDQLEKICKTELANHQNFKVQNAERFRQNELLCRYYRDNFMDWHYERFLSWIGR